MKTILVTGFEAFGHTPVNPAEQVARRLDGWRIDDATVVSRIVPNSFFTCIDVVRATIEEVRPEVVVMMGEYRGNLRASGGQQRCHRFPAADLAKSCAGSAPLRWRS